MPSRGTVIKRITKETSDELDRLRETISKELGIDLEKVQYRHAEIVLRLKARRGKIMVKELQDVMLGRIE